MSPRELVAGLYYRARRPGGREVRLLESIRGRRCTWRPAPGFAGTDGRQLVRGRTCLVETFARWALGPEQLDLFGGGGCCAGAGPALVPHPRKHGDAAPAHHQEVADV